NGRVFSACMLFAPNGERIARYDKMHLFRFQGRETKVDETKTVAAGKSPVCVQTPLGKIALSVCYDLRFPELFRAADAPDIIAAPSAFTVETGAAHWELLLRARAVENLAHIIAPAQAGTHPGGRKTFGHSMLVDCWGRVLAAAKSGGGEVVFAEINGEEREAFRKRLPALLHRQIKSA
ncbi:MAG: carbon-nitrogen hydrolase family protein, partial [Betaproteobacteria bacterium]|nr:carbon-nitrogen hydrolase family protein [Betaproteobacteria bacterium]